MMRGCPRPDSLNEAMEGNALATNQAWRGRRLSPVYGQRKSRPLGLRGIRWLERPPAPHRVGRLSLSPSNRGSTLGRRLKCADESLRAGSVGASSLLTPPQDRFRSARVNPCGVPRPAAGDTGSAPAKARVRQQGGKCLVTATEARRAALVGRDAASVRHLADRISDIPDGPRSR